MGIQEEGKNQAAGTEAALALARPLSACHLFLSFSLSSYFYIFLLSCLYLFSFALSFFSPWSYSFSCRTPCLFVCVFPVSSLMASLNLCTFVYSLFFPDQLLLNPFLYDIDVHEAGSPYN